MSLLGGGLIIVGAVLLAEGVRRWKLSNVPGYPGTHREIEIPKPPPTKDARKREQM